MTSGVKKILILKLGSTFADLAGRCGDFENWIMNRSGLAPACFQVLNATTGRALPDPADYLGVILTGSHDMVTDRRPWSEAIAAWIPTVMQRRVPLLGICYGHQLIAHALGGRVGDNPNGMEMGAVRICLAEESGRHFIFKDLPGELMVIACHTQSVLDLPPGAVRLASSAWDPYHAFAVGKTVWGVQFHPEFDARIMETYIHETAEALIRQGQHPDELIRELGALSHAGSAVLERFCTFALQRNMNESRSGS